ncbi:hypothetical protein EXS74_01640 [Candidatus Woesearchaeota archaeon]|nr:hypothetical protein [Candidatus Woesearchaeota archaeon]
MRTLFSIFIVLLLLVGVFGCAQRVTEETGMGSTEDASADDDDSEELETEDDDSELEAANDDSELDIADEEDDLGEVI